IVIAAATLAVAGSAAGSGSAQAASNTSYAYGWPVKPFDRPHPVRGNFGDPRTIFAGPPTERTLLSGPGAFQFHDGIDISAPDGTAVYAVASGTVASVMHQWLVVDSGRGRSFQYWHVASVHDMSTLPVIGEWHDLPVAPALIEWRIQRASTGNVVVPTRVAYDVRNHLPAFGNFWRVYARGTHQNMSVFGKHYSYMQPGVYLYRLAPGGFDTRSLPDNVYELVVTATDIRGNHSSYVQRFSVHNRPAVVGA